MTYEEFEKCVVVEPTRDYVSGDMVSVELRFQAGCKTRCNRSMSADNEEMFVKYLKREFYDYLFARQVPLTLVEESGMTEDEFVSWCMTRLYMEDRLVSQNAYVIEWRIDEGYKTLHGISGIFLSREDAVSALEGIRTPCHKKILNGIWKLGAYEGAACVGEARPMTKDGVTWEIYGPDGGLVDGNGMDEPEYTIQVFEVGRIEGMGL